MTRCKIAVLALFGIAAATIARASSIDFETGAPPAYDQTSPLTTTYAGIGVTFSGADGFGGSILDQASSFGIGARSGDDFLAFNLAIGTGLTEIVSFSSPVNGFSIYVGGGDKQTYTASAFDSLNGLLGTTSVDPTTGVYGELSLPYLGISSVTFSGTFSGAYAGYVADDLSFDFGVPEPATWSLMLLGVGLAGVRLRAQAARSRKTGWAA